MTREATPEFVKADFNDATFTYMGVTSRMTRDGDRYFLDTVDPAWALETANRGIPFDEAGTMPRTVFSVDRIVGSHWFQQLMHKDPSGRYTRLPVLYHLVETRWIPVNGAFLAPPSKHFHNLAATWNETCLFCHNTRVQKNAIPMRQPPFVSYQTEVGELGISCEACHGAAERHVALHQNPARRLSQRYAGGGDPTIVNPARL